MQAISAFQLGGFRTPCDRHLPVGKYPIRRHFLSQQMPQECRSAGNRNTEFAALGLLAFAALNLNHVFNQFTETQFLLWPVVTSLALILLMRYGRLLALTDVYLLFVGFLSSYLILASLASVGKGDIDWIVLFSFSTTLVFVSGLYFWFMEQAILDLRRSLKTFKALLVLSCLAIVLSPFLGGKLGFPILGYSEERAFGLFEDPNEAAVMALYTLVLVAAYPERNRWSTAVGGSLALFALLLTFSKAGFLILLVLTLASLIARRSMKSLGAAIAVLAIVMSGIGFVAENDLISEEHKERLVAISSLLHSGEITPETTTGRTLLWEFAWEKIQLQMPWGAGLGEFLHMEGGYRWPKHPEQWFGVHNLFLLVLGEGGLLPFMLLVCFMIRLFAIGKLTQERKVALGFAVVLTGYMMSTHDLLSSRVSNVALAAAMATLAKSSAGRSSTSHEAVYRACPR